MRETVLKASQVYEIPVLALVGALHDVIPAAALRGEDAFCVEWPEGAGALGSRLEAGDEIIVQGGDCSYRASVQSINVSDGTVVLQLCSSLALLPLEDADLPQFGAECRIPPGYVGLVGTPQALADMMAATIALAQKAAAGEPVDDGAVTG